MNKLHFRQNMAEFQTIVFKPRSDEVIVTSNGKIPRPGIPHPHPGKDVHGPGGTHNDEHSPSRVFGQEGALHPIQASWLASHRALESSSPMLQT